MQRSGVGLGWFPSCERMGESSAARESKKVLTSRVALTINRNSYV
jgi:hypothetical protein